jgi:ketosteroid isomerase-like protein
MSREHVEALRKYFDLVNQGRFDEAFGLMHDDVVADFSRRLIEPGVANGRRQVVAEAAKVREAWNELTVVPESFHDGGDSVVVELTSVGRGALSGAETRARTAELWTFRGERVIHWVYYGSDLESALEAAGLRE